MVVFKVFLRTKVPWLFFPKNKTVMVFVRYVNCTKVEIKYLRIDSQLSGFLGR